MEEKISKKVSEITKTYREKSVEILPGLKRNIYDIIKRVYFYRHDRYVQCSDPNAIFWQVVTPYIPHYSKLIDIDSKDLNPSGIGDVNFYQTWILRRKFQAWVEENNFNVEIDDLTKLVASFGSYVWKWNEATEKIEPCDLRHLAFDATAKSLRDTDVVEYHYLTESAIRGKSDVWKNTDDITKKGIKQQDTNKLEVWEFWGDCEYKEGKFKYMHVIGCGFGAAAVIAFQEDSTKGDSPYYDFHLDEYDGTWLRKGAYEKCFPEQERANTIVNENAQATSIASLLLLRSSDPNTQGNVLQQAISGQIITSADLEQINIENKAFTILLNELEKIERQVQKKLMLPDIATGDNLPSGTPFRGMAMMSNAFKSAFKQIRSHVSAGIVDVTLARILPSLVKKWNKGDILEIAGNTNDIDLYNNAIKNVVRLTVYERANAEGTIVTPEVEAEIDRLVAESMKMNGRKIEIPKNFFNFKYGLVLDPMGEIFDKSQQNDAIIQALTMTMQNPAITGVPAFKQLLENNGISPFSLTVPEQQQMMASGVAPIPPQPLQPGEMQNMMKKKDSLSGQVDTF